MPRSLAIITFVGFYIGLAVLLVVAKRLTDVHDSPSRLALPMLAVVIATLPACAGFAIGAFKRGGRFSFFRCASCAVAAGVVAGVIAALIARVGFPKMMTDVVVAAAAALVFVTCWFLSRLAGEPQAARDLRHERAPQSRHIVSVEFAALRQRK